MEVLDEVLVRRGCDGEEELRGGIYILVVKGRQSGSEGLHHKRFVHAMIRRTALTLRDGWRNGFERQASAAHACLSAETDWPSGGLSGACHRC